MKVKHIEIGEFRCFKDLKLELTYPEGHPKAGQPLEKVCLIGQSGTGKTTLLEILYLLNARDTGNFHPILLELDHDTRLWVSANGMEIPVFNYDQIKQQQLGGAQLWKEEEAQRNQVLRNDLQKTPTQIVYFPTERYSEVYDLIEEKESRDYSVFHHYIQEVSQEHYWQSIKESIVEYQEELSKFRFKISKAVESGDLDSSKTLAEELDQWRKANPGVLEKLGRQFLDPILSRFHLKTKTELDSLKEASFLQVVNTNGESVPPQGWTTGTKNIILKTVPLFALKPTERDLILIDEPENSLFPDIQAEIVEHYRRLAPDSQIFFATHSPIVASCFEPWEVIDLEFDSDGNVIRNDHLIDPEKGWHVDNFDYNPKWLSYEGIYRRYFDFEQNANPERDEKLTEAASLKKEAQYLQQQGKTEAAQEKFYQYQKLARKLE